ncbi:MAG: F0F1 ATP synthase subunit A [Gemmataceae bacterium]|nr:F0F1 ATP synthase subunit A [Gemmataceae bacterium]MCS7270531.1 F0F1 ATP synthase subunit A [Gemmataceae bacterium]MDW8242047.1 F0F1 ATP synthase subunit A [Thermogemmata sp.]
MADTSNKFNPFEHVADSDTFHIFETAGIEIRGLQYAGIPLKFILLMTVCAVLVAWMLLWLGRKMRTGEPPTGKLWNLIESLVFFVRDKIARPALGEKEADDFLPYLTTLFLFIFAMNLIGLLPFLASPTASIMVTGALALVSFFVIHLSGIRTHGGLLPYLKTFIPHIHLEGGKALQIFATVLIVGMAVLEYLTAFIRVAVLAIRLLANMLAGHTVLFVILFFIALVDNPQYRIPIAKDWMFWIVAPFSVVLVTALTLLELFIAGLQAFIFTFLTAVFIGLAKHPPH